MFVYLFIFAFMVFKYGVGLGHERERSRLSGHHRGRSQGRAVQARACQEAHHHDQQRVRHMQASHVRRALAQRLLALVHAVQHVCRVSERRVQETRRGASLSRHVTGVATLRQQQQQQVCLINMRIISSALSFSV